MTSSFSFVMLGEPPSYNHMYKDVIIKTRGGDSYRTKGKQDGVESYQVGLSNVVRQAKPRDFSPQNQIIVSYVLHMHGGKDADNVMKACNDAIAAGLDGVNDNRFLIATPQRFPAKGNPRIVVTLYDADYFQIQVVPK